MNMDEVGCMVRFKFLIFIVLDPHALDAKFYLEVNDGNEDNNLDISQDEDENEIENDKESKKMKMTMMKKTSKMMKMIIKINIGTTRKTKL